MRQLLIRMDDSVHARLTERAQRERRSVNALVNEVLVVAASVSSDSPRELVRSRAAALGVLAAPLRADDVRPSPARRGRIIARTRGLGPVLDDLLDEERGLR